MAESSPRPTYNVEVAGLQRALPIFEIAPGVRIAIMNILGDVELVQAAAEVLTPLLLAQRPETILTAEAKSIPLVHVLAALMDRPYVVLRKTYKPYMGQTLSAQTQSITTGATQTLFLDEKDVPLLRHRRVAIVDDVISTGSTLQAMRALAAKAEARIVAEAAIFTEGDVARWQDIIALGHLPVFIDAP